MSFCGLLLASLFNGIKFCKECQGWFFIQDFIIEKSLCTRCDFSRKILDKTKKKKHKPLVENHIDLTK